MVHDETVFPFMTNHVQSSSQQVTTHLEQHLVLMPIIIPTFNGSDQSSRVCISTNSIESSGNNVNSLANWNHPHSGSINQDTRNSVNSVSVEQHFSS